MSDLHVLSLVGLFLQGLLALVHASILALSRRSGRLRIGSYWLAAQLALLLAMIAVGARNALNLLWGVPFSDPWQHVLNGVYAGAKVGFFVSVALGTAELLGRVPTSPIRRGAVAVVLLFSGAVALATGELTVALPWQGAVGAVLMGGAAVGLLTSDRRTPAMYLLGGTTAFYALLSLSYVFGWRYVTEGAEGDFVQQALMFLDRGSAPDLFAQFLLGISSVALNFEQHRDVTDRTGQQRTALHREAVTTERLETLGRVAATVAHELNNPLSVVLAVTEQLLEQAPSTALRDDLQLMHREAMRCRHVARELLLFSRDQRPAVLSCDATSVLHDAIAGVRLQAAAAGVRLRVREAPDAIALMAEEIALQQVLINLLRNAIDVTPRGRQVHASVTRTERDAIFEVEDEGPGMSPDIRAHLDEVFFTTKPAGEGTGLGLAIVRGIVARHGGSIEIETTPQRRSGTRFRVHIPLRPAPSPADDAARSLAPSSMVGRAATPSVPLIVPTERRHVLVIDDEVGIRHVLARLIRTRGFDVTLAADGVEAREALAARPMHDWTAVFCDVRMPREDGLAFTAHIERQAPALLSRLVLLTGDTMSERVTATATRTGCRLLAKPFRQSDVDDALHAALASDHAVALSA